MSSMEPARARNLGQVITRDEVFHSAALGRDMRYRVLLPADYEESAQRFPVLYLLHGVFGDWQNWTTLTNLAQYASNWPLLMVMPDAGDSWYVNSPGHGNYEDYVAADLVGEIERKFRTMGAGKGRGIAGLSMGGYAAVKLALKDPQAFGFAGSLSGAFRAPLDLHATRPDLAEGLLKAFGAEGNATRRHNDIFALLESAEPSRLPHFYLACGTGDDFLETNRQFAAKLQAWGVSYEYHENPGGHEWQYWDAQAPGLLSACVRVISSA